MATIARKYHRIEGKIFNSLLPAGDKDFHDLQSGCRG